ncbi:ABC transporter ATP-binding protein [Patescibacteria group bacterium]|nr:ABC transporter ATP-binding protein [Patescibacteria group bacterium]
MSRSRSFGMPKVTNGDIIRVFFQHVRRYWWQTLGSLVAIIVAESCGTWSQWYYKKFVDLLSAQTRDVQAALEVVAVIIGIHLLGWVMWRVSGFSTGWTAPRIASDLERSAFSYLLGHSYQFFSDSFAGSLVRRVGRLSRAYLDIIEAVYWRFLPLIVSTGWVLYFVSQRSPKIALLLSAWVLLFILFNLYFVRIRHQVRVERAAKDSEVTGAIADALTNIANIKLFTGFGREMGIFDRLTGERRVLHSKSWYVGEVNMVVQNILMLLVEVVVMYMAVRLWAQGTFTVGDVVLFQGYILLLFNKLFDFGKTLRSLYEAFAEAQEMVELMALPHGIVDRMGAKALKVKQGEICFEGVNFQYQTGQTILKKLDVTIASGEKVALVGPSGAGKSTVVKTLFRFYDLTKGKILIDGQDLSKVTQDSIREAISLVPQDPILFHRTLKENIRYGKPEATDEEVIAAAKQAHCHAFISGLEKGYDTYVGERGVKLSGGERQRVAIARAILKNAPILVLDEATSSLDSESEHLIQDALQALMKDKTVIVIAHRLSTIMQMDRIVVLEQGGVAATGTHQQLLQTEGGLYKKLWQLQAGGFLAE